MKTRSKKLALVAVLGTLAAFVLSGCELVSAYGISIHKDGSAEVSVKAMLDKEFFDSLASMGGESSTDTGEMEEMEFMGNDYYGTEEVTDCDDLDELVNALEDAKVFSDIEVSEDHFSATYTPAEDYDGTSTDELTQSGVNIKCYVTVTFDYPIADTNGEIDEDDECTVTWNILDLDEEVELYADAKTGPNVLLIILIVAGALVVAGGVVAAILIIKNKKKNSPDKFDTPADTFASPYAPVAEQPAAPAPVEPEQPAAPTYAPSNPVDINNTPEV